MIDPRHLMLPSPPQVLVDRLATDINKLGEAGAGAGPAGVTASGYNSTALAMARQALAQHMAAVAADPDDPGRPRIPKIIHQVYGLFGQDSPPPYLRTSLSSFRGLNRNYTHILWGELGGAWVAHMAGGALGEDV